MIMQQIKKLTQNIMVNGNPFIQLQEVSMQKPIIFIIFSYLLGPGRWNDPDMLLIGNNGLSHSQSETQMAMWAMWSAPLIMSNDLNNLDEKAIKILQNRRVIAVNQDPLGKFGKRILQVNQKDKYKHFEIWVKELYPVNGQESWAIVYLNRYPLGNFLKVKKRKRIKYLINVCHLIIFYFYRFQLHYGN